MTLFVSILFYALSITAQERVPVFTKYDDLTPQYSQENDTLYVVNFWATWCKPCVAELPFFIEAEQSFKTKKVKFILVSLDFSDQLEKRVIPFLDKNQMVIPCVLLADQDANDWIPKVDETWSGAIPATVMYKGGKKTTFLEGNFHDTDELKSLINKFL